MIANELEETLQRLTTIFGRQAPSMEAKNQWNQAMFKLISILNREEKKDEGTRIQPEVS